MERRGEMETEMRAGTDIIECQDKTKEKKESEEATNRFEGLSKVIRDCWEEEKLPVGFSALYPLYVQSNLCARTSTCNWKTDCSAKWWRQKKKS